MMKNVISIAFKKLALSGFLLLTLVISNLSHAANPELNAPDPTQVLDHFMCYDVEHLSGVLNIDIHGKDQFLSQRYRVFRLVQLCAPVKKIHNNKEFDIKYGYAHLACYKVIPHEFPGTDAEVVIKNQFQKEEKLYVDTVRTICVPTLKDHLQ